MFDGRTLHSREVMERLVEAWGDKVFHTVIRRTIKFSDSTVAGVPITSYAATLARVPSPTASSPRRWRSGVSTREPARRGRPVPRQPPDDGRPRRARADPEASGQRAARRPSGRVRHDEKMTVYVTADELLDIEHARLSLRRHQGLAVDRGRLVREAIAIVLADLEANGDDSVLVQRLTDR